MRGGAFLKGKEGRAKISRNILSWDEFILDVSVIILLVDMVVVEHGFLLSLERNRYVPSGKKRETALLGAQNRYALRLAGHQSPRHVVRDGPSGNSSL